MESVFNLNEQQENLGSKIIIGLEKISEAFKAMLWEHAKVVGLSPIQIQVLIFLAYHNEKLCNVSYLSKEFNVTKPTMSDAVKVIHEKKLISKTPSSVDSRSYSIQLTRKGKKIVDETEHFTSPLKKQLENTSSSEQKNLFESITKLIYGLNKTGVISVQRTCFGCSFYYKNGEKHYCTFLQKPLSDSEIRLDCPEYEVA
ncbi:MAG: MarR family winged helix-turn-helix transcriptional regulator [Bacteroidota bacterium]